MLSHERGRGMVGRSRPGLRPGRCLCPQAPSEHPQSGGSPVLQWGRGAQGPQPLLPPVRLSCGISGMSFFLALLCFLWSMKQGNKGAHLCWSGPASPSHSWGLMVVRVSGPNQELPGASPTCGCGVGSPWHLPQGWALPPSLGARNCPV